MLSLHRLERKQKIIQGHFEFAYFSFFPYSFGIEIINTFIHPVDPSKTIPDSRPKWAKFIPVFRPKQRKNPTRWGRTDQMAYRGQYSPTPGVTCDIFKETVLYLKRRYLEKSGSQKVYLILLEIRFVWNNGGQKHSLSIDVRCPVSYNCSLACFAWPHFL